MRFLRLDLTAYGRFANESLDLSGGNYGVHLVFGPNEAGKSTLLRAIKSLLFGMKNDKNGDRPELTFRHSSENLRIGALLADRQGKQLEVIRRKGAKNSLRAADDETRVDEGVLQALLNIDQRQFAQQFGLHYQELVQGGQAIAEGKGDVGEILFAAAAGLANFTAVQKSLVAASEELFTPTARNRPINKALSDLKETRKRVTDSLLSADEWKRKNEEVDSAIQTRQALQAQATSLAGRISQLEAYLHAHPDLQRLEQLQAELASLADVPLLPPELGPERVTIAQELAANRAVAARTNQELTTTRAELQRLPQVEPLLAQQAEIQDLTQQHGAIRKAASDRIKRIGERDQLRREIAELQCELGEHAGLAPPPRAARKRLEQLADEVTKLQQSRETLQRQMTHLESELRPATGGEASRAPQSPPPASVLALQRRAQAENAHLDRLPVLQHEVDQLRRQLQADRQRLRPTLAAEVPLATAAFPAAESLDRHEQIQQDLAAERKRLQQAVQDLMSRQAEQLARVKTLKQDGEVPSPHDLQRARAERDQTWQQLRDDWTEIAAKPIVRKELTAQFEDALRRADDLADRLRRDAAQVAELSAAEAAIETLNGQLTLANQRLQTCDQAHASEEAAWKQAWASSGVEPLSPREMRGWLARVAALQQLEQACDAKSRELDTLQQREQKLIAELAAALEACALTAPRSLTTLAQWVPHVDQELATWQKNYQQQQQAAQVQAERSQQLDRLRGEIAALDDRTQAWRAEWTELLRPLGLPPDLHATVVRELIQLRDEIQQKAKEEQALNERIAAIDKDQAHFHQLLTTMGSTWLESVAGETDDALLVRLQSSLREAERSAAKQQELQDRQAKLTAQSDETATAVQRLEARLAQLCQEADCSDPAELPQRIERAETRRQRESEHRQVHQRLISLAGSTPLDEFIAAAKGNSSEHLRVELDQMQLQSQQCREALVAASERAGALASERSRWQGTDDAAAAEQDAQCLLSQIRDQSEQFIRLRLASAMLRKAVETWRESNQDPVLKRASELFAQLTLGSFSGIRSDLNDDGESVLVGLRSGKDGAKELVTIDGLSSGTCDQLYLAIRLASLEVQLGHREPLPVIVDDCLINFDDDRSRAALQAVGQLSQKTQVIMLTHHARIVELAQSALDPSVLFVHHLQPEQRGS
jgi:uncharacterized protein YhaN